MKRIKPFVLEGGKTIAVNRKDRKHLLGLDCKIPSVLHYLFIYYGSQKHGRNCMSHQLPLYFHQKPMTLRNYTNKQISFFICIYTSISVDLAMDITDPSSMQNACHINFVIDLAHRRVSVVEHRSAESEGLRLDSLQGHIILFFDSSLLVSPKIR